MFKHVHKYFIKGPVAYGTPINTNKGLLNGENQHNWNTRNPCDHVSAKLPKHSAMRFSLSCTTSIPLLYTNYDTTALIVFRIPTKQAN